MTKFDRTQEFRAKNARRKAAKKLGKIHVQENRIQGRLLALNHWNQRAKEARQERESSHKKAEQWTEHRRRDEARLKAGATNFCSLKTKKCDADPTKNRAPKPHRTLGLITRRDIRRHCAK